MLSCGNNGVIDIRLWIVYDVPVYLIKVIQPVHRCCTPYLDRNAVNVEKLNWGPVNTDFLWYPI